MAEGDDLTLILVLMSGTLAMLILALGLFFFFVIYQKRIMAKQLEMNQIKAAQQQELLRTTIEAEENERKRFAEDLHDEIGAMLSAIKMNISRLEKRSEESIVREIASDTKSNLDMVINNIRRITRAMIHPSLERLGLGQAIREQIGWFEGSRPGRIFFSESGNICRFPVGKELAIFRIVQELLNNSVKYSQAQRIDIRLKYTGTHVMVLVSDNGVGFDVESATGHGLGLRNLKGRADVIQARFRIRSAAGKGTSAVLTVNYT